MDEILRSAERDWQVESTWETLENLTAQLLRSYGKVVPDEVVINFSMDLIVPTILNCIEECTKTRGFGDTNTRPWRLAGDSAEEALENLNINYLIRLNPPHSIVRIRRPKEWQYDIGLRLIDDYVAPANLGRLRAGLSARGVQSYLLGEHNDAMSCLEYCFKEQSKANRYDELEVHAAISDEDYYAFVNELCFGFEKVTILPSDGDTVIIFHFDPTLAMWGAWLADAKLT